MEAKCSQLSQHHSKEICFSHPAISCLYKSGGRNFAFSDLSPFTLIISLHENISLPHPSSPALLLSQRGPHTSSSITQEPVRNASSRALPKISEREFTF